METTAATPELARGRTQDFAAADVAAEQAPGLPDYLVRHYAWAYLWPSTVWFFDHQWIINAILFGNYRPIMRETLRLMQPERAGRTLQIAAVYGELTPKLAEKIDDLHLIDVARVQLDATQRKLDAMGHPARLERMDCERLAYASSSFDTAIMFLLLHEMPADARRRTLCEAARVLRPGGRLVIAEYGALGRRHPFHRLAATRWILEKAEPYLGDFWREDLAAVLRECSADVGRSVELDEQVEVFDGFYRVLRFTVK